MPQKFNFYRGGRRERGEKPFAFSVVFSSRNGRLLRAGCIGVVVLWTVVLMVRINRFAHILPDVRADAAIVLEAAVWEDQPSPVFEERIKHGIMLYQSGVVDRLIFTGGLGEGDRLAEGEAGRRYALARGVPDEAILIETVSTITLENLIEAQKLMGEQGFLTNEPRP